MNLAEIRNLGAFVSPDPVKVKVEWKEHQFDVWVKQFSFGELETLELNAEGSRSARIISASILLGEAKEPIQYEDAFRLDPQLASKLIEAFNKVNGLDQKKVA
jgi:hypothetical protein